MAHIITIPGAFHKGSVYEENYNGYFERGGHHVTNLEYFNENNPYNTLNEYVNNISNQVLELIGEGSKKEEVVLLGHSMGGVIAQGVMREQKNIDKLILLASSPLKSDLSISQRFLLDASLWLLKDNPIVLRKLMQGGFFASDLNLDLKRHYIDKYLCGGSIQAIKDLFSRKPIDSSFEDRSVFIIGGKDDINIPQHAHENLKGQYKNSKLVVVPGSHDLMLDPKREKSAQQIEIFLKNSFL